MKKLICITVLAMLVSGCATAINKQMQSWVGANVNDLIASWGPPQQTMPDGEGGQILIYAENRTWTMPGKAVTTTTGFANTSGNINTNTYGNQTHGNISGNTYGNAQSTTTYTPPQTTGYTAQRMFWADSKGIIYRWSWRGF